MYNYFTYVECIEISSDCHTTFCNILDQFKVYPESKDVKEAQEILKSFLMENKTFLVFDNMKYQSQIEDIMPIDDMFATHGGILTATTQNSKAM